MTAHALKLAKGLTLPLEVVTKKLAWLGVTGSGKTYGATKLAELLAAAGAQFVALDPVGVWYGLRLDASGKKPSGIKVPVFGGLHGDVPIESTGGALLADLIVDKSLSAIIDVSQFESDAQKARFAEAFADRLFQRRKAAPAAMHLFLEECQEFVPQNPQRGEERMLHVFTRMQKLGRNYGIGSSYISQRPQEVNKKALNMAQTLFVFRTTGTHERKAIEQWIHDKALDQDIAGDLPKIPTGDCHVWSPEFLNISAQVHILEKATFNASSEPEVGAAAVTRELAPIDLAKIREDMAATIEKAKADDPKELRRQILDLQKAAASFQRAKQEAPKQHTGKVVEKPVFTDADRAALEKLAAALSARAEAARDLISLADARLDGAVQRAAAEYLNTVRKVGMDAALNVEDTLNRAGLQKIFDKLKALSPQPSAPSFAGRRAEPPARAASAVVQARGRRSASATSGNSVGGAEQRLLDALAELEALGVPDPERVQVAFFAGYTNLNSKGLVNALGALRSGGLIEYPTSGRVVLTTAGRTAAAQIDAPRSPADVRDRIVNMLGGASARLLDPLIKVYPKAMARAELAAASGYGNLNSKGFVNAIGRLRSLGFIDYPQQGQVAAQPVLFLEGRR